MFFFPPDWGDNQTSRSLLGTTDSQTNSSFSTALTFTSAKEQSTSEVNTGFYLLQTQFELAGFSCSCPSHLCFKASELRFGHHGALILEAFSSLGSVCRRRTSLSTQRGELRPEMQSRLSSLGIFLPGTWLSCCRNLCCNKKNIQTFKKSNTEYL